VAILLATLALTTLLVREAHKAFVSHRTTAERTLRDYAEYASWQFATYSKEVIYQQIAFAMSPIFAVNRHGVEQPFPPPTILMPTAEKELLCPDTTRRDDRVYFRYDLRHNELSTHGGRVTPAMTKWLSTAVPKDARANYQRDWHYTLLHGKVDGAHRGLVYGVAFTPWNEKAAVYGFTICSSALSVPVFRAVQKWYRVLPPTLTGDVPNDSLFSILITEAEGGDTVYQSAVQYASAFSGETRMKKYFGDLVFRVTLRPDAASALVIGGLPRSRWPFLVSLLVLTAGLVGVALLQIRRQEELARLRTDFVSGVSHELRTPLAQIRMFAETLRLGRVRNDQERQRSLEVIDQEARRLTHLVENVLQFSRQERSSSRLTPERVEVAPLLRDAIETFAPLAEARQVHLHADLIDGIYAVVDRGALRQMLLNLLDNAVKYGPAGQTVTVGLDRQDARVRVRVDDEGPGIPAGERERIWDPFIRCKRDANSAVAGSGIGLAVVRELVTLQGGRAWSEAAPGGGARFVLDLPEAPTSAPSRMPRDGDPLVPESLRANGRPARESV
jgi:signal transduction histidine kinase